MRPPSPVPDSGVSRRALLRWAALGGLGTLAVAGLSWAAVPLVTGSAAGFGGAVDAGTLDSIASGRVKRFPAGKFWLSRYVEPALGDREVLLALYWKCAHLGCTVDWVPQLKLGGVTGLFRCPCHGSIYARSGQNIAGPTLRPLDIMALRLDGGRIWVDTGRISQRIQYDPQQATVIV